MFCFLYLTLKESKPAYLSEKKKHFKCVVRPRENFINRFLWTYTLIKRAILTSKLQKDICKNRAKKKKKKKNQDIEKNARFLPEFLKVF